ncbi:MAG TPA: hypothetical protein VGB62_08365 [Allosphingosinicella sp.]|jgi:hypothetical protein
MAEILLLHPPEKKPAALQLAEALAAQGYRATLEEAAPNEGPGIVTKARTAPAALLIWSRTLASDAVLEGWLAPFRQLPQAIEVTTDSITPNAGDESHIILLSGWRGQPYHQGWQRILNRLRETAAPKAAPGKPTAPREEAKPATGTRTAKLGLGAAAALTLAAAVGATAWVGTRTPSVEEVTKPVPAATAPVPTPTPQPSASLPPAEPAPIPEVEPTKNEAPSRSPRATASKPKPTPSALQTKGRTAAPKPVLKRYTKRGAKKMRRFCAKAGRNTPECRTFAYSMAARRR